MAMREGGGAGLRREGIVRKHRPGEPRALRRARAAEAGSAGREPPGQAVSDAQGSRFLARG